jgi:broad specificity phosphatase PhoE
MASHTVSDAVAHNAVTLDLASKESVEHMKGMREVYAEMRQRPLLIQAYLCDDAKAPASAKTVHFVRHGQGFHNLLADLSSASGVQWKQFTNTPENPYVRPEILDAPLTENGRQQALRLQSTWRSRMPHAPQPQIVVCSPNCRALQTALLAFEPLLSGDCATPPFVAHEMVREETGVHVCDQRRPTSRQTAEFPQIDFSLLTSEEDPLFSPDRRETKLQVANRVYRFMEWLADRPEQHVAVVGHSGWLLTLFNAIVVDDCDPKLKEWFQTGEMRSTKLAFLDNTSK